MKKMFYVFAIVVALVLTACGNKKTAPVDTLNDSTKVEVVVDSTAVTTPINPAVQQ